MALQSYKIVIEMKKTIVDYLEGEKEVWEQALKAYDTKAFDDVPGDVKVLREREAIKLRDRITELTRHIKVIKSMFPEE